MNLCDYCEGVVDNRTARKGKARADGVWFHDACEIKNQELFAKLNQNLAGTMRRLGRAAADFTEQEQRSDTIRRRLSKFYGESGL